MVVNDGNDLLDDDESIENHDVSVESAMSNEARKTSIGDGDVPGKSSNDANPRLDKGKAMVGEEMFPPLPNNGRSNGNTRANVSTSAW